VLDGATDVLKVPPHSIDAEQSVLGGLLLENESWNNITSHVSEDDFYRPEHRHLYRCIESLANANQPFDVVTACEWLQARDLLDKVGGLKYIAALADNTPGAANIVAYADIVRERSVLRNLIRVGNEITESAFNAQGRTSAQLLDQSERMVFEIADQHARGHKGYRKLQSYVTDAINRIDALYQQDSHITGVATGYHDFDNLTAGLQRSDLVIVAGRPSMGKTTFAINCAEHAAIKGQKVVVVFSMEMSGEQLAMRMLSSLGRIDQRNVRTGKLTDDDWPRLTSAVGLLSDAKMYIDDTPALTPTEVRARCRRIKREHGELGLVVVDYLQLMQVPGTKENRATEISEISRSLKALAKEMNVPVVALSQLNRSLETRPDKRPVMSDLRESGAIEQDADVIVFIYRDEVYNEESADKGIAEIIIGKQRNGPLGKVRLTFLGQFTRFENFANESYSVSSGDY
jgi:replicative DNA helicase